MERRNANLTLVANVLKDDYLTLDIDRYAISEHVAENGQCEARLELRRSGQDAPALEVLEGRGVGVVDAVYNGLIARFAQEFPSLTTLAFTGFRVVGEMETSRGSAGADAVASVTINVRNSEGLGFEFEARARSVLAASIDAVVQVGEFFVNSERAFILMHRALLDAKSRHRADLVERYTSQLAELVKTTSYTQVIERIRRESL
jgi:hypothetical protein